MSSVTCLVADDHPALAGAVAKVLAAESYLVIGPCSDGDSALAAATERQPAAAVLDYRMPRLDGAQLVARLRAAAPRTAIAVYTAEADELLLAEALDAGADAVVLKEAPIADLLRALKAILAGGRYVDPALAAAALAPHTSGTPQLTQREREVLRLVADGHAHEEIGRRLAIGAETVRTHLKKAADRLHAANRTQAVATALRLGLID